MRPDLSKTILENISDPTQRRTVERIMTGRIVQKVKCLSKKCRGRIVAFIYSDGTLEPQTDRKGVMHLLAWRKRMDGHLGFQCDCGNDSRLSDAEKGVFRPMGATQALKGSKGQPDIITAGMPDKAGMEEIARRLQASPPRYPVVDGVQKIDNFSIESV